MTVAAGPAIPVLATSVAESRIGSDSEHAQQIGRHVLACLDAADLDAAQLGVLRAAYTTAGKARRVEIIRLIAPTGPLVR
jgi:hypothetical protein